MSLVKRAYVEADIWVHSGQNAGMLVAQNFTDIQVQARVIGAD